MTKLKRRFIAKQRLDAKRTWGVYDTERAAWPATMRPPVGPVQQLHKTEADAQAEADRLERLAR